MEIVTLSVACSIDGYMDDASARRLLLSSPSDLQDIQRERARHDAILVGAGTVRADNPRLDIREPSLVQQRVWRGCPPQPSRVTLSESGAFDTRAHFFRDDGVGRFVLCPVSRAGAMRARLGDCATVLPVSGEPDAAGVLRALREAGIGSLFVEGGTQVLAMFLSSGLFSDFRLAIAPLLVGTQNAARLHVPTVVASGQRVRLQVTRLRLLGDTTVINYAPAARPDVASTIL